MKGEPEDTGFDPETVFDEGRSVGQSEADEQLREQIAEQLVFQGGFDADEVEELLFSDGTDVYAPRRGRRYRGGHKGKRRCSAKQWAKMPQICRGQGGAKVRTARHPVMVYDTAPRRGRYRAAAKRYYGGAKKRAKAEKTNLLFAGGAALTALYMKYSKRAADLKKADAQLDGKPVDGIWKALMYDLKNRPVTPFMDRLEANSTEIFAPLIGGIAAPYVVSMIPKVPTMVKDVVKKGSFAAVGYGVGNLIGTVLDDIDKPAPARQTRIQVQQPAPAMQAAPAMTYSGNPTGGF